MIQGVNPILRGFNPDPSILRVGNDFYIATSTFQWFGGVELYHSLDLVNWELLPSPLSRKSQLDMAGNPNSGGVWAPCLSYSDGTFYLVYSNVKNFHGIYKDVYNYLVTTNDLHGEWSEPVYLNSSGFDASLFHDDDGKKYLLNMRWDHRMEKHDFNGILIQEYSEKEKRLVGEIKHIYSGTAIGATEAPHIYKRNGYYYLMVAEGGTMYNHGVRMARSKSIFGPYETDEMPVLTMRDEPELYMQRTGHGSLVDTPNGEWFIAFLGTRPYFKNGKNRSFFGRETCIDKVYWNDEGWLRLSNQKTAPEPIYYVDLPEVKLPKAPSYDDFNCKTLPRHFKTLRVPFDEIGSLSARDGYLRLYGHEAITSCNKQSMVGRRYTSWQANATAVLEFEPKSFQQMAGLSVFYDTYNFFYLYMSHDESGDNVLRIIVRDNLRFYNPLMSSVSIGKSTRVWLRADINRGRLTFFYSLDGKSFTTLSEPLDCSNLCDEAYEEIGHEGHTGTFVCMCCQDLTGEGLHADFESFEYNEVI